MQKISISKANDHTYDEDSCIIQKTQKQTSEKTTQIESSNLSILIESETSSSTTKENILNINLIDDA